MAYTQTSEWTRSFLAATAAAICVIVFGISTVAAQDTCHSASRVKELRYVGVEEKLKPVRDCWLRKVRRGDKDLFGAYLEGTSLPGADLRNVDLNTANLSKANLEGALLNGATLVNANLSGAILTRANLGEFYSKGGQLFTAAVLTSANLRNAVLDNADFSKTLLYGAHLAGASINGTKFKGAKISNVTEAPNVDTDWTRLGATAVD